LLLETPKQDSRDSILDAAERLLTRYGYRKMTMSDLAEEAGIGVGTTYLHFSGKAKVALAVIVRANLRVVAEQQTIAASVGPVEERLAEVLTQRVLIRFERVQRQKHTLEELRAAIQQQKGLFVQAQFWREQEIEIVSSLLLEGKAIGKFQFEDVWETADAMLGATEAFLPRYLRQEDLESPTQVPERVERIIRLLLRAVTCTNLNA
jgi:AcrR family transcriptional regulator